MWYKIFPFFHRCVRHADHFSSHPSKKSLINVPTYNGSDQKSIFHHDRLIGLQKSIFCQRFSILYDRSFHFCTIDFSFFFYLTMKEDRIHGIFSLSIVNKRLIIDQRVNRSFLPIFRSIQFFLMVDFRFKSIIKIGMIGTTTDLLIVFNN